MDVQSAIEIASSANATTMAAGDASAIYRAARDGAVKVTIALKESEVMYLKQVCKFPLLFSTSVTVTHDHPLLCAMREIARHVFSDMVRPMERRNRTLVVGSSAREIRMYDSNQHIHFHIHGRENKDYARIVEPALKEISTLLKKKLKPADVSIALSSVDTTKLRTPLVRFRCVTDALRAWNDLKQFPNRIHTQLIEADTLLFEDSIYNFTEETLCELFDRTNARIGYGYALLPNELMFPDMPANRIYKVFSDGKHTCLTFRTGHSNGYRHLTSSWSVLLRKPGWLHAGVGLAVEITARIGPMAVFKIYRCDYPERIVRSLELDETERYVYLLDVWKSVDMKNCQFVKPLRYFTVRENEYWQLFNYIMRLDEKSHTLPNAMNYVCRRMGGVSLVNQQLVRPWDLADSDAWRFTIAVFLDTLSKMGKTTLMLENFDPTNIMAKIRSWFRTATRAIMFPVVLFYEWLFAEHLTDRIVLVPNMCLDQTAEVTLRPFDDLARPAMLDFIKRGGDAASQDSPDDLVVFSDDVVDPDAPVCPFCIRAAGFLGKQKLRCEHKLSSDHEFELSDKQVSEMLVRLMDDDNDPQGLREVKQRAKAKMPVTGFKHKCRVEYVMGGPGTGKSTFIRGSATAYDLILAPFSKLKPDYMNVKSDSGDYDMCFKTQHRGICETGHATIYVDEFTSFPYEFLAVIAYNNKADTIYLCGDDKQTKVKEPDEGMYIGNHMDLTTLSKHTLVKNFRSPRDVVDLMRRVYGYEMEAVSDRPVPSYEIISTDEAGKITEPCLRMAFTHASAKLWVEDSAATVRRCQGQDTKLAMLFVTNLDGKLPTVAELAIVGLTRHKEKCYIVVDDSDVSKLFISNHGLSENAMLHVAQYTPPVGMTVVATAEPVDPGLPLIENPVEHAPKDSHLLGDSLIPAVVHDDLSDSMNELESQAVGAKFRTAQLQIDHLVAPTNVRHHPVNNQQVCYSFSRGYGKHYSGKKPLNELAVIAKRYDSPKPKVAVLNQEGRDLAVELVDYYFESCKIPKADVVFGMLINDDHEWSVISTKFFHDATVKHYSERLSDNGFDANLVRFHLKNIFKPETSMKDLDMFKVGQGIAAWSVDTLLMFCLAMRFLAFADRETDICVKGNQVFTDNGVNDIVFQNRVIDAVNKLPDVARYAVLDQQECDSTQNEFSQYLERVYWRKLGVNPVFLEHFYAFRARAPMIAQLTQTKFRPLFEKHSGAPDTLLNNGVLTKVFGNALMVGDGPKVSIYKGDDWMRRQLNIAIDEAMKERIAVYLSTKFTVHVASSGEFCGFTIGRNGMLPNIRRQFYKVTGIKFRDYDHFCEYQKSLRDWVDSVKRLGLTKCIENTVMLSRKMTPAEAESMWFFIEAISHIDYDGWIGLFKVHVSEPGSAVPNADLVYGVDVQV